MHEQAPTSRPFAASGWYRIGAAAAGTAVLAQLWSAMCTAPAIPWNPARLAPTFALAKGLPIYALRDSGAQLGWGYGPIFPLWYLPVTLSGNPTTVHMLAVLLNAATLAIPLLLLSRVAGVRGAAGLGAVAAVAAGLLLGHNLEHWHFYFLHVDTVCTALGAGAALALHRAAGGGPGRWLPISALLLALAFWTKQLALPLYPALACWLWAEGRRDLVGRFLFWSVVFGAGVTLAVFACFGTEQVLFMTWLLHARRPWLEDWPGILVQSARHEGIALLAWLPLVAWAWAWRKAVRGSPSPSPAASLVRLLLWMAAWSLPLGIVANFKPGGGLNSIHTLYYLFAAGLTWLTARLHRDLTVDADGRGWGLAWVLALSIPLATGLYLATREGTVWQPYRGQERLLAMARGQPGRYYFPWNPLVTLIAEGRVQPLDDGLYCLWQSGLEVPADKVRAAVPPNPIIVYEEPAQSHFALRYFPRRNAP